MSDPHARGPSRRHFLRGVGAAVALPALDSLGLPRLRAADGPALATTAAGAPLRTAFVYFPNGAIPASWWPSGEGSDFELKRTLQPLEPLKGLIQVLGGLDHKTADPGKDGAGDHARGLGTFLTGVRLNKSATDIRAGVSIDQVLARRIGHLTRFPSLELACDSVRKAGACDSGYSCAYQFNLSWSSPTTPVPAEANPRLAFERLFGAGAPGERRKNLERRRREQRSILDFALDDARAMQKRLDTPDRAKLDQFLTGAREIETRIEKAERFGEVRDPGVETPQGIPSSYEDYVQLMFDLLVLAFQTDSTRVATLMLAHDGSNRSFDHIGISEGHHDLTHHQNRAEWVAKVADIDLWYARQFARFLERLQATTDADGRPLLHNSMIVYGSGNADANRHTHTNLPVILAGAGGGTLTPGRYVKHGSEPLTNLFLTLADRLGVRDLERFGDSAGPLGNVCALRAALGWLAAPREVIASKAEEIRRAMRTSLLLALAGGLVPVLLGLRTAAEDRPGPPKAEAVEAHFRASVRPFLEAYCLRCHGPGDPKGDLDLNGFTSAEAVAKDLSLWALVLEQLEAGSMPPAKAKAQPTAQARGEVIAWIGAVRKLVAARNAGDPGLVAARRLNNAEYDNTIRDLTGVDLRPTKEFPVDPANEAGFDNSAESLAMSPALVKKYLEAARGVADHAVLTPDGLGFVPHPMLADTDRDKYCVKRIIDFYKRQETDHADYFQAAWLHKHRAALGRPDGTLDAVAYERGLSRKYLATIWGVLTERTDAAVGPIAAIQVLWDDLPAPEPGRDRDVRGGCERMREVVVTLRGRLVPEVKNLTAPRIGNGTQPFVLWKNRQVAANRMRYAGGAATLKPADLGLEGEAARALAVPEAPEERERFEATFERFCRTFPDAFYVSERARVYLDPKGEKGNAGRLLSAGFHSMTGYFRDDGPLSELMLDEAGQRELDRLWREFDFITGAPMRQYASYLWFERAETGFLRGDEAFDFVRAEDKDAASEAKMGRFAEVYLAKARRVGASELAIRAIEDQFRIIAEQIRRVESDRREAEPRHVQALQRFAERAYRRPLADDERRDVAGFYRNLREADGLSHEDAVRDTIVGILMSPHFLYRVDLPGDGQGGSVRPLSDHDLASRLSYFLWASLPDEELLAHAAAGDLSKPDVLTAQARRLLRDGRARGLAEQFAGQWLDFRRFEEHNGVDHGRFPAFDDALRHSMFEEPIRFFLDVVQNDRPVARFLDGKHTFVNAALARHYGMPAPSGGPDAWVRVDDATPYGRGGLLPMAVFLTRNSPGLRTSPVKRGYWVVKRLMGETIPAPPADVPDLPDDEAKLGELTLRETLARHRADMACAGCHERFDAIGLAFEGYGPVGEARTLDLGGRRVETRATFPRGGEGSGVEGLRAYLGTVRRDEFVDNLCRKLLAYGLGRSLIPSDDATVEAMRSRLDAEGGRFGALVEAIVTSPQFLNKRIERDLSE